MCKLCWVLVGILVFLSGGMAYKFMFQGQAVLATDGRMAIKFTETERNMVLGEMREFLETVQTIISAANQDDMPAVAAAAKKAGMAAAGGMPGTLTAKLPMEFKKLGFDTHKKFDQLALDADSLADPAQSMEQLGIVMENCISCHAAFKLELEQ